LHWDLNPWRFFSNEGKEYEFDHFITEFNGTQKGVKLKVQGLINLGTSGENDGGFITVPGFHQYLEGCTLLAFLLSLFKKDFLEWVEKSKDTFYAKMHGKRGLEKIFPLTSFFKARRMISCMFPNLIR